MEKTIHYDKSEKKKIYDKYKIVLGGVEASRALAFTSFNLAFQGFHGGSLHYTLTPLFNFKSK